MCKYCENISESWQIEGQEYDIPPLEYLVKSGIELIIKDGFIYAYCQCGTNAVTEIDFCPKCGTPLGDVKPLTVEKLRKMNGKPVFVVSLTGKIEGVERQWCILDVESNDDNFSGAYIAGNDHMWFTINCYGTTWLAFVQEQKGETE